MTDGWGKVAAGLGRTPSEDDAPPETVDGHAGRPVPAGWETLAETRRRGGDDGGGVPEGAVATSPVAPRGWEHLAERRPPTRRPGREVTLVRGDDDPVVDDDAAVDDEGWQPLTTRVWERFGDLRGAHPRILLGSAAAVVAVIVAVVLVVVFSGGGLPADAAFSVNGKVTTVAQLKSQVNVLDQLDGVTAPAQSDTSAYNAFLRTSAQALAVQQLVGDIAHHEGISVPEKTTSSQLDQIVASKYNNDRSQFDAALSSAGLTENDVLSALNAQAVESALYDKHTNSKVPVTDAQVAAAYDKNQPFTQPEERAISIIVVATQATGEDVLNQLNSGANFATLAAQDSLDSSKSAGGADGTYSQQDLQQSNQTALASTVFGATLNAPFGPVQATGGEWVVGEVTAITPAATYGNDAETQAAIKNYLVDQQLRQQWIAYLAKQLKGADITYAPAYRPAHPGQPPQPTLPSISQFVINAHQSTTSGSSGTSGTSGTSPSSP